MRYEYQDAEALAGDDFWALCNQLGADGWRLMDRRDYEMRNGSQWTIGVFERVTVHTVHDAVVAPRQPAGR